MLRDMEVQWHAAWRVSVSGVAVDDDGLGMVVVGEGVLGSHRESPPSLVSLMFRCVQVLGESLLGSGASNMVPVATSHSHSSAPAEGEERLAQKTWHPQVGQK